MIIYDEVHCVANSFHSFKIGHINVVGRFDFCIYYNNLHMQIFCKFIQAVLNYEIILLFYSL